MGYIEQLGKVSVKIIDGKGHRGEHHEEMVFPEIVNLCGYFDRKSGNCLGVIGRKKKECSLDLAKKGLCQPYINKNNPH